MKDHTSILAIQRSHKVSADYLQLDLLLTSFIEKKEVSDENEFSNFYTESINSNNSKRGFKCMVLEVKAIERIGPWSIERIIKDRKVIKTKWVFYLKRDGEGKVVKCRSRPVANEYSKIPVIYFSIAFSQCQGSQQ